MRIVLRKISDEQHALAIVRADGQREEVELETRSLLMHDLIHYAVEAEAKLEGGFWGTLAGGATLAQMGGDGDRIDRALAPARPAPGTAANPATDLAAIERLVGALSAVTKGRTAAELAAGMQRFADAQGARLPAWLTEPFVAAVLERMRRLTGRWRATPYGGTMELRWPE